MCIRGNFQVKRERKNVPLILLSFDSPLKICVSSPKIRSVLRHFRYPLSAPLVNGWKTECHVPTQSFEGRSATPRLAIVSLSSAQPRRVHPRAPMVTTD